jgi:hypothetical protein
MLGVRAAPREDHGQCRRVARPGWRSSSASSGSSSAGIFRTARGANADLKVHKGRIPGFRRTRNRNGLWSILLVVLTVLFLTALVHG